MDITTKSPTQKFQYPRICFLRSFNMGRFLASTSSKTCLLRPGRRPITIAWKVSKYGGFPGPYFPAFELNTEYFVSFRIQSECSKIRTRKNSVSGHFSHSVCQKKLPYLDTFHVVLVSVLSQNLFRCLTFRTFYFPFLLRIIWGEEWRTLWTNLQRFANKTM